MAEMNQTKFTVKQLLKQVAENKRRNFFNAQRSVLFSQYVTPSIAFYDEAGHSSPKHCISHKTDEN